MKDIFVERLPEFGLSFIANIIASIKLSKYMNLGPQDAIITVATDGADLYLTELEKTKNEFYGIYDKISYAEIYCEFLKGISTDHTLELNQRENERIFNLGYYTWVEQQGVDLNDFEKRRDQQFWRDHFNHILSLDDRIEEFNAL